MDGKKIALIFAAVTVALCVAAWLASNPTAAVNSSSTQTSRDRWNVSDDHSPMDDSKTVVLSLDSDDKIDGPLGPKQPTLIIRCQEGKTEVYAHTGMAASVEEDFEGGPIYTHTVKIRLDQGDAVTEHWGESTAHDALFSESDGIEFAKQLAGAQTLIFQFTPFDANPAVAHFDVQGLDAHLTKVADACGWSLN
jgi:type VI secretion system protein VasI